MGLIADRFVETFRSWFGPYSSGDPVLAKLFGGSPVSAGVVVNEQTAMAYAPFAAAVTLISNVLATVPLHLYRRVGESRERASGHPLDRLVATAPNAEQSSLAWRRLTMYQALTAGVSYSEIQRLRDGSGRPAALWPIEPDRVTPHRDDAGRLVYRVRTPGTDDVTLRAENLLVILGPGSPDGITPSSPVQRAMQAIGLGLAAERFGATFFGNGSHFGGILSHPGRLGEEAVKRLRTSLKDRAEGVQRSHDFIILEEAMKYERLGVPPEEAQFLATRQHQINEIARVFGLPPTLIGGNLEAGLTYQNAVQEAQRFVDQCLLPWGALCEQELNKKLLDPDERDTHYFELTFEGLLRGDVATRYGAYRTAIETGFMTPNEARARENLPALPDGAAPSINARGAARSRPDAAVHAVVADALGRVLRRWGEPFLRATDTAAVRERLAKLASADPADGYTTQVLMTAFALVPGTDVRGVARGLRDECVNRIQQVLDAVAAAHVPGRVQKQVDIEWPVRAGSLAAELIRNAATEHSTNAGGR